MRTDPSSRRHIDGVPLDTLEQHSRGLDAGASATPTGQIGDRGAGKQDSAHRVGETGEGSGQSLAIGWKARRGVDDAQ